MINGIDVSCSDSVWFECEGDGVKRVASTSNESLRRIAEFVHATGTSAEWTREQAIVNYFNTHAELVEFKQIVENINSELKQHGINLVAIAPYAERCADLKMSIDLSKFSVLVRKISKLFSKAEEQVISVIVAGNPSDSECATTYVPAKKED